MRKFVLFFLTASILLTSAAFAEEIDYSSLSDDELLDIMFEVSAEITTRGIDVTEIANGRYIVGVDIRSGKWEITNSADRGFGLLYVKIYNNVDDNEWASNYTVEGKDTCYISLEEGMVLELASIGSPKCYIKEVENSFAP